MTSQLVGSLAVSRQLRVCIFGGLFELSSVTFVQMQAEVPKTAQKPNFYN